MKRKRGKLGVGDLVIVNTWGRPWLFRILSPPNHEAPDDFVDLDPVPIPDKFGGGTGYSCEEHMSETPVRAPLARLIDAEEGRGPRVKDLDKWLIHCAMPMSAVKTRHLDPEVAKKRREERKKAREKEYRQSLSPEVKARRRVGRPCDCGSGIGKYMCACEQEAGNGSGRMLCECKRRWTQCKKCAKKYGYFSTYFCEHGRAKRKCKECGGAGICQHGRRRYRCKECGGVGVCKHAFLRQQCKACNGVAVCANVGCNRSPSLRGDGKHCGRPDCGPHEPRRKTTVIKHQRRSVRGRPGE